MKFVHPFLCVICLALPGIARSEEASDLSEGFGVAQASRPSPAETPSTNAGNSQEQAGYGTIDHVVQETDADNANKPSPATDDSHLTKTPPIQDHAVSENN